MGSRRTHGDRMARLREAGLSDAELGRLASPIGLDLGARTPGGDRGVDRRGDHRAPLGRWRPAIDRDRGRIHHDWLIRPDPGENVNALNAIMTFQYSDAERLLSTLELP